MCQSGEFSSNLVPLLPAKLLVRAKSDFSLFERRNAWWKMLLLATRAKSSKMQRAAFRCDDALRCLLQMLNNNNINTNNTTTTNNNSDNIIYCQFRSWNRRNAWAGSCCCCYRQLFEIWDNSGLFLFDFRPSFCLLWLHSIPFTFFVIQMQGTFVQPFQVMLQITYNSKPEKYLPT